MSSTPEGLADFKKTQEAAMRAMMAQGSIDVANLPRKVESVYVLKSSADSIMTVYDIFRRRRSSVLYRALFRNDMG